MKKKYIVGSMIAVCMLMLLPTASAVESNIQSNRMDILNIRNINQAELREKILNDNSLNTEFQTLLLFLVGLTVFVAITVYIYVSSMIAQP